MKFNIFEGIQEINQKSARTILVEKWERSGFLRGLDGRKKENMSQLLENQARALKESVSLSTGGGGLTNSGQIQGYSTQAFPVIRKIFGGLVANELVSIQPLSLPSGMIFYLDYTYGSNVGGDAGFGLSNSATKDTYGRGRSIYGNPTGKGIRSGSLEAGGMYNLVGSGYSRTHQGTTTLSASNAAIGAFTGSGGVWAVGGVVAAATDFSGANARGVSFDPIVERDLGLGTLDFCFAHIPVAALTSVLPNVDLTAVDQIALTSFPSTNGAVAWGETYQGGDGVLNLRQHNKRGNWSGTVFTPAPLSGDHVQFVIRVSNGGAVPAANTAAIAASAVITDKLVVDSETAATVTLPTFESDFGATPSPAIPEIDMKIESIAITTQSRKLKARWTPEVSQDLNAYQSMDAEVELTNVLSEHIAIEIDREILLDILTGATGASLYWSRAPGKFVNKLTGEPVTLASSLSIGPNFTGTVREWYETLIETMNDAANSIHRKTLRGSANFAVTSPDVSTIFESTTAWRAKMSMSADGQMQSVFQAGCEQMGSISSRYTVYKDPYFPRNQILLGYKGGSYLETGYVYSPYVPLIVTQTIYKPEDFTPQRAVFTRYGKKLVRSDFYGRITVLDLSVI